MSSFHPDLTAARYIPAVSFGPLSSRLVRSIPTRRASHLPGVRISEILVPGEGRGPDVPVRLLRPDAATDSPVPALLWIHGGGLIIGDAAQDDRSNADFVRELGIVVASVDYRLAPAHRGPAAVEDCYAALRALHAGAGALGIDPDRIAIGGASAGGGLAAALAQLVRDRGEFSAAFQLLIYPMLDDRTVRRRDVDTRNLRAWTTTSNRYGWTAYLGRAAGSLTVPPYTVPARTDDLSGLPPAWIGVGDLDLFHDEDLAYAARLAGAGVEVETLVMPGAFHGFDAIFPRAGVSREFWRAQAAALRSALSLR